MKLSAVVLTKNEEENITECLKGLSFCDELIVIDDYSSDDTVNIAKSLNARVYKRNLKDNFARQRNYGLKKSGGDWILFVDPDERLSSDLKDEIIQKVLNPLNDYNGYYILRRDILWGRKLQYGESGCKRLLRIVKKGKGEWVRGVHEVLKVDGKTGSLKNPIYHFAHDNLNEFIKNVNLFSAIHFKENVKEGKNSNLLKIIFWPKLKFLSNYIFKGALLDGQVGFVSTMMMSFHSYLSWSKQWLNQSKN